MTTNDLMSSKGAILLTGGAGFIGGHLTLALLAAGYEVDVVDNLSTGNRKNVPAGARFFELDLRYSRAVNSLPSTEYMAICHLAGQSSTEKSFEDPLYDFDANARSTLLLSKWALEHKVQAFLHASSVGVYGQLKTFPVSETVVPRPISHYSSSKLYAEQVLQLAAQQGLRTVSFRMTQVYGPNQDLDDMKHGMVKIYLTYLLRGEVLIVKGSLNRVRDLIYIDDVVAAWKLAIEKPVQGIYNLGSGQGIQVRTLIEKLIAAMELDENYPVRETEGTPNDQFAFALDCGALRQALDWEPKVELNEGLSNLLTWARTRTQTG